MTARAFACGATLGLAEAVRGLLAPPQVDAGARLLIAGETALGFGLAAAAMALALRPFVLPRAVAPETPERRDRLAWAVAAGVAVAALVASWRLRHLAGFGQPELLPLAPGALAEGGAVGLVAFALASRLTPRRARAAWRALAALAALGLVASAAAGPLRQRRAAARPASSASSVLLVSIDTLRADRLGAYGRRPSLTPHLDRLATESALFSTVLSPAPLTGPSHTTMLTGLYPARHGATANGIHLRDDVPTLAEMLARSGYSTAGFVSGWPLSDRSSGLARRFQSYDDELGVRPWFPHAAERVPLLWLADRALAFARAPSRGERARFVGELLERDGAETTGRALRWIARQRGRAFFAFVHYYEPHGPYAPPAAILRALDPAYQGALDAYSSRDDAERRRELLRDPRQLERIETLYDGEVVAADAHVGRLLAGLDRLGRAADTVVIVTSDHGESLTEHGEIFSHAEFLYDSTQLVPLLVRTADRRFSGRRIDAPVRLVDFAPTVLELAGERPRRGLDGASLVPLLAGNDGPPRHAFGSVRPHARDRLSRHYLRTATRKLIWTLDERAEALGGPAFEELYALDVDPGERHNLLLAAPPPPDLAALRELLRGWLTASPGSPVAIDPEVRRTLQSLGYL